MGVYRDVRGGGGRTERGALALTHSTAKCRYHAMKQTNKSSVRPTAAEKYATISHISLLQLQLCLRVCVSVCVCVV